MDFDQNRKCFLKLLSAGNPVNAAGPCRDIKGYALFYKIETTNNDRFILKLLIRYFQLAFFLQWKKFKCMFWYLHL